MNPYAAPRADIQPTDTPLHFPAASGGKRFLNYFIDQMVLSGLIPLGIGVALAFMLGDGQHEIITFLDTTAGSILLGLVLSLIYYGILEGTGGTSLGKLITGTRVVRTDAAQSKPGLGQILGRTLARFIPFEPFSILGKAMWHDALSGTTVVDIRHPVKKARQLSEEEIRERVRRQVAGRMPPASPSKPPVATPRPAAPLPPKLPPPEPPPAE